MWRIETEKQTGKKLGKKLKKLFEENLNRLLYSNFEKFNKEQDLEFYSNPIITNGAICIINSGVRNTQGQALKIKWFIFMGFFATLFSGTHERK